MLDDVDTLAELESNSFSNDDLQRVADVNQHQRDEKIKGDIARASRFVFWVCVAVITAMGLTWAWHILTPASLHYLARADVQQVQTMLFSGTIAGLVPLFAKKYM